MAFKTGVVYLQKDKFQFFSPYIGRIFEFRFSPEAVRDLDIINSALLENLIKVFITNSKITPSNLVIVLAENAYFVKDFIMPPHQKTSADSQPEITLEVLQKQAIEFIEHVPFDNVVSKTIPLKDGMRVCATNKDFYESIAVAFEHLGFTIESIVPGLILGNGMSLRPVLDQAMASVILQKINSVKQYDLLGQQVFQPTVKQESEEVDESAEPERIQTNKTDRKRLVVLSGVFASLVIVLIIVYVQSQSSTTPPRQPAIANTASPTKPVANPVVLATPLPISPASVTLSALQTQNITIQIVNSPSSATIARNLANQLETYKFESVSMQTQSSVGSANTIVSFSSSTGQNVRDAVLNEVKKYESNVSVQEKQIGNYDITIVLSE